MVLSEPQPAHLGLGRGPKIETGQPVRQEPMRMRPQPNDPSVDRQPVGLRGGERSEACPGRFCFCIPCPLRCDFCICCF
ncbi:uncharacterized protein PV09_01169 [Verruconis gallopava]|uniref:Uncharacterized protein n=1 Tax=Verruconis gallopava TaxID=253628 RepID=A0A0D1Z5I6_9PEZI|nr:uncharacterized protein PV09_01169 [Verruconis gallopava]KIW08242.1 hypothetical protein PV09_01169 [Verruconis gallopava]